MIRRLPHVKRSPHTSMRTPESGNRFVVHLPRLPDQNSGNRRGKKSKLTGTTFTNDLATICCQNCYYLLLLFTIIQALYRQYSGFRMGSTETLHTGCSNISNSFPRAEIYFMFHLHACKVAIPDTHGK